jgi:hypothetical protein
MRARNRARASAVRSRAPAIRGRRRCRRTGAGRTPSEVPLAARAMPVSGRRHPLAQDRPNCDRVRVRTSSPTHPSESGTGRPSRRPRRTSLGCVVEVAGIHPNRFGSAWGVLLEHQVGYRAPSSRSYASIVSSRPRMNIACDSGGETSVVHRFEHEREARRLDRVKRSSCVCGPEPRDVVLLMGLIEPPLAFSLST